jgi:hypothetical protein
LRRSEEINMSQSNPAPGGPYQEVSQSSAEEGHKTVRAFGKFVGQITPWLLEVGSWVFGGLIAFNLIVIAALITVGPVDQAVLIATAAFALSLPLDVTGLVLLRLLQDLKQVSLEEGLAQNFQDFDFTVVTRTPATLEALREKRTRVMLGYSLGMLTPSALLTLAGMTATMWHMAWWIGVGFFGMVCISLVIVNRAIVNSRPAESQEGKEARGRYREEMIRQAKDPDQKNEEAA